MECLSQWPEPVHRVQCISESGVEAIPDRYVKPPSQRPAPQELADAGISIPLVDLSGLDDESRRASTLREISDACREWGFFQAINHGVPDDLLDRMREVWRGFFHLPLEEKQVYANNPKTYEGYGSRLGVEKGAILDWGDYFFLLLLPSHVKDSNKWPALPENCRDTIDEYSKRVQALCGRLLKAMSISLGLREDFLKDAFGGEVSACLRVNYYPKCPQPDLTLALSSHSDPGGMTVLLADDKVKGLQVRKDDKWVTIAPYPHSFIVNVGDQIQVISNGIFKSVEHRVVANSGRERISAAFFCNPKTDVPIGPAPDLVSNERPARYVSMTFDEYRLFIRQVGPRGKCQVESLKKRPTLDKVDGP
ncbi:jasmonate-induced oxygenase 2 [Nymphaea colorata]|nr:jasmonate-induced oxygenase 2 [Nymphaea colorata]